MSAPQSKAHPAIRRYMAGGFLALALLVGAVGGWAATTELSGAVVAPGALVVDTNVKKVQHPTGGVLGELLVREGDTVTEGKLLARLDETITRANLAIVLKGLDELSVRQARLEAERDGSGEIAFQADILARADTPDLGNLIAGERKLFEFRSTSRSGQKSQFRERISQLGQEISGLTGQAESKQEEIDLITKELESVRDLWRKNLIPISRITALERESVRLKGERSQLISTTAQARGKITEIELQIIQIDQDLRSEVAKELREIQAKNAELVERKVAAEDQLKRVDIRAPQDGIVHQLAVHTIGGVISASEPIMLIVPLADELTVEAKIPPQNIDQLSLGQRAVLRFSAFDQRTTPELNGVITRIAADVTQDQKTGMTYYVTRVTMPATEIARLNGLKLIPGMPLETFIQTGDRTVLTYLVKPLSDQIAKAFRER